MADRLDEILSAVKAAAEALGLTIAGEAVAVDVRKECEAIEGVDTTPVWLLSGKGPESAEPFSGGDPPAVLADYTVQSLIVAPGNRDLTTAQADLTTARRKARGLFDRPWDLGVSGLLLTKREGPGQDAGAVRDNYDSLPMSVRLRVVEDAGN